MYVCTQVHCMYICTYSETLRGRAAGLARGTPDPAQLVGGGWQAGPGGRAAPPSTRGWSWRGAEGGGEDWRATDPLEEQGIPFWGTETPRQFNLLWYRRGKPVRRQHPDFWEYWRGLWHTWWTYTYLQEVDAFGLTWDDVRSLIEQHCLQKVLSFDKTIIVERWA